MEQKYIKYVNELSKKLREKCGISIIQEIEEERYYRIEYRAEDFKIEIEKYHREFYVSLYKINKYDDGINLFNLVEYLKRNDTNVPISKCFYKINDLEECYSEQFQEISEKFFDNYEAIRDFFSSDHFSENRAKLILFRQNKYPEFYRKIGCPCPSNDPPPKNSESDMGSR